MLYISVPVGLVGLTAAPCTAVLSLAVAAGAGLTTVAIATVVGAIMDLTCEKSQRE